MPRRSDPIKKVTLPSGQIRYRFSIDVGKKVKVGKDGRPVLDGNGHVVMVRDQRVLSFKTRKEAEVKRGTLVADRARGTLVATSKMTLAQHLDAWLEGRRDLKRSTKGNYRNALKPVYEELGAIELQKLSKANIDQLVNKMLTAGRRRNRPGTPLSASTVNLMLTVLTSSLDDAMRQGHVLRNVGSLVERPKVLAHETSTWTADQAAAFLAHTSGDRLAVAWSMSLYGMRRGEVLGLRWSDVDLVKKTMTIRKTRGMVDGQVVEDEPKTERSKRTLPLDQSMVDALTRLQLRQREEADSAGEAYGKCPDCAEHHVVVDELGDPMHPESYSDKFEGQVRKANLPKIRLHDARHTCGTLMHLRGVPTAVISAWLGHASAAFTMRVYVHSQDDALRAAMGTLSGALQPVEETVA